MAKESKALELVEAGMTGDWNAVLSRYATRRLQAAAGELGSASAAALAKRWSMSVRTVRAWRSKTK